MVFSTTIGSQPEAPFASTLWGITAGATTPLSRLGAEQPRGTSPPRRNHGIEQAVRDHRSEGPWPEITANGIIADYGEMARAREGLTFCLAASLLVRLPPHR